MAAAGAAIDRRRRRIDAARRAAVWEGDEIKRVVPVIERLARERRRGLDRHAQGRGDGGGARGRRADGQRRLGAAPRRRALEVVAGAGCPVVLMHSPGDPEERLHGEHRYGDVLFDVYDWLEARIAAVVAAAIAREKIIVDPGIGFGKSLRDNLRSLNGLALFHALGCPILLGASRKRMIGALSNEAPADKRLGGIGRAGAARARSWAPRSCASTTCPKPCRRSASGAACAMRR